MLFFLQAENCCFRVDGLNSWNSRARCRVSAWLTCISIHPYDLWYVAASTLATSVTDACHVLLLDFHQWYTKRHFVFGWANAWADSSSSNRWLERASVPIGSYDHFPFPCRLGQSRHGLGLLELEKWWEWAEQTGPCPRWTQTSIQTSCIILPRKAKIDSKSIYKSCVLWSLVEDRSYPEILWKFHLKPIKQHQSDSLGSAVLCAGKAKKLRPRQTCDDNSIVEMPKALQRHLGQGSAVGRGSQWCGKPAPAAFLGCLPFFFLKASGAVLCSRGDMTQSHITNPLFCSGTNWPRGPNESCFWLLLGQSNHQIETKINEDRLSVLLCKSMDKNNEKTLCLVCRSWTLVCQWKTPSWFSESP